MILTKVAAGALGTVALAGTIVFHQGVVDVDVQEKKPNGEHVRVIVPAALIPMALMAVPDHVLQKHTGRHSEHLQRVLPAVRLAARELEKCPDAVLVEVQSDREHVRIEKRGGKLIIDVDDAGDEVHVSIPLVTIDSVLREVQVSTARPN